MNDLRSHRSRGPVYGVVLVALVVALVGPRDLPAGAQAPPGGSTATTLPGQLDAVMARFDDLTGSSTVAAVVTDADGQPVWSTGQPDQALLPASTMKVLTAASVLHEFGLEGRVRTEASATAPVGGNGVVRGDVVVVGAGDPTLTTEDYRRWIYPSRPATAVEELAQAIVDAGVRRITGSLVTDGTRFGPADTASGWPSRYFADFDAHYLGALTVDTGREVLIDTSGDAPVVHIDHEPDPARHTARVLGRALAARGVVIEGAARRSVAPQPQVHALGGVASPPMREVLGFMLRESDNHMADTLVRTSALHGVGHGSWAAADRRVRLALTELDVPTEGLAVADGSGLSRNNRVSPSQLVATDVGLTAEYGDRWTGMLAVGGQSGTLEHRLLGTSAEGRLHAKTGTLADVRALVGHVGTGADRYHFAMMVNDVDEDRRYLASMLGDELALVLTDAIDGCQRVREVTVPVEAGSPGVAGPSSPATTSGPSAATSGPSPAASGSSPATRTVERPPTAREPGPFLQEPAWSRRCPSG